MPAAAVIRTALIIIHHKSIKSFQSLTFILALRLLITPVYYWVMINSIGVGSTIQSAFDVHQIKLAENLDGTKLVEPPDSFEYRHANCEFLQKGIEPNKLPALIVNAPADRRSLTAFDSGAQATGVRPTFQLAYEAKDLTRYQEQGMPSAVFSTIFSEHIHAMDYHD